MADLPCETCGIRGSCAWAMKGECPNWRAEDAPGEALIADLDAERHAHDQTRNQLLACQLAKSMAEEALTAQIARAEKAEAALERRTRERDRARAWIIETVSCGDWPRDEVDAALADEPEEVAK